MREKLKKAKEFGQSVIVKSKGVIKELDPWRVLMHGIFFLLMPLSIVLRIKSVAIAVLSYVVMTVILFIIYVSLCRYSLENKHWLEEMDVEGCITQILFFNVLVMAFCPLALVWSVAVEGNYSPLLTGITAWCCAASSTVFHVQSLLKATIVQPKQTTPMLRRQYRAIKCLLIYLNEKGDESRDEATLQAERLLQDTYQAMRK